MNHQDCQAKFGQPHADLVNCFRRIAEAAFVQADLLTPKSQAALQAFDVYVTTTRKHDASHRSWALFGLLVRLAQVLHVDRESLDETFFMQQLRRRLWHHILVLDSFFAYDRGSEIIIRPGSWHRPLPVNLNDEDLVEYSTASTVDIGRKQPTDMTFALAMQELYMIGDRFEVLHSSIEPDPWQRRLELTRMHNESVQEKYTQHCDPNIPFQRLTIQISRIIQSLNMLNCVRSFQRPFPSQVCSTDAPWILELAIDVLRKTEDLWADTELVKWNRLPWVQWHPLAIALAGLCTIRKTPLAEEAWTVVNRFMERSAAIVADGGKGRLWQAIARLHRRALAMRDLEIQPKIPMEDLDASLGFDISATMMTSADMSNALGMLMPDSSSPALGSNDRSVPTWLMTSDLSQWPSWQYPVTMQSVDAGVGQMPWA